MVEETVIRQVWQTNLESEFMLISNMISDFPFASFDTEFPGTVYPQPQQFSSPDPFKAYETLKRNVDSTNIIQLGLTLANAQGKIGGVWEFNFRDFNLARGDLHNPDSIELLKKQGIDFKKNAEKGIDSRDFRKLMLQSWLTPKPFSPVVTWIGFQNSYDFGYLLKILLGGQELPDHVAEFLGLIERFFGKRVYDLKHMMKNCTGLYGGLEKVAETLDVHRTAGRTHQAGSDSLLTMMTFKKMRSKFFPHLTGEQLRCIIGGVLHGLEIKVSSRPQPVWAAPVFVPRYIPAPPPVMVHQTLLVCRSPSVPVYAL